jgi:hypothetical protein
MQDFHVLYLFTGLKRRGSEAPQETEYKAFQESSRKTEI